MQDQKKRKQRLYKLAYLQFKQGRVELLKVLGKLGKAYRMGWTANREWQWWKQTLHCERLARRRVGLKKRRRKGRNGDYILDNLQRHAERGIFDMYSLPKGDGELS
jgi:hypothetical protein